MTSSLWFLSAGAFLMAAVLPAAESVRPRARDLGLSPGVFEPGKLNAITDVPGVLVGHTTLIRGDNVRTGVTAILPHGGNIFRDKVPAGIFVGNAFGKLTGALQVEELGAIETPIVLTNTLNVGTALEAVVAHTLQQAGNENVRSVNAVVGETNDHHLNDIRGQHVQRQDVLAAIQNARTGLVAEGSVGAGTGTVCYGWKGGIGTSSRVASASEGGYVVGVLVQTNFGGILTMGGAPVGIELGRYMYGPAGDGSCMIVVATNAPLTGKSLKRVAARALYALARTGSSYSNGSGDFAIAVSTAETVRIQRGTGVPVSYQELVSDDLSPLFQMTLEATEEAVYNSLLQATSLSSRYESVEAIPVDRVREILMKYRANQVPQARRP